MTRVAVVTRYFPTSFHPWAGHSAYQTLRLLADRWAIEVFYMESRYPERLRPRSRTHDALDPEFRPGGVDVEYIPYPALPLVSRPLNGWMAARKLLPRVRAFRPDVLLNYVVYPDGFAALRIARELGVPVVVTAIGSDLNQISDPICGALTRRVLREADYVVTVSDALRRKALAMGARPEHSRAVLNGCDTSIFYPQGRAGAREALGLEARAEIMTYIGRIDVAKGLRELVEAVAGLRAERPELRCYLVGDGPDEPVIRASVESLGAGELVRIVPPCSSGGVAQWMAASDAVALPSYREGCPNVIVEALACGRPVVASDVGGIPELMSEDTGRMVPARDVPALREAIAAVLDRAWDAAEISQRHSRGWTDVAEDVFGVIERVLERPGRGR